MPTSSELLARMRSDKPVRRGCSYGKWLSEQDKSIQDALALAVKDPGIHAAAITRFVRDEGFAGSPSVVKAHLNRGCSCE